LMLQGIQSVVSFTVSLLKRFATVTDPYGLFMGAFITIIPSQMA